MVTAIIVGAGHCAMNYAGYSQKHPDKLKITGVVELDKWRRENEKKIYNLPDECCFSSIEELVARGKIANAAINGTMDHQHVVTTLPLLEAGYDILLEKPFAINETEALQLKSAACRLIPRSKSGRIFKIMRFRWFPRKTKGFIRTGSSIKMLANNRGEI